MCWVVEKVLGDVGDEGKCWKRYKKMRWGVREMWRKC